MTNLSEFVRTENFFIVSAPIIQTELLSVPQGEMVIGGRNYYNTSGMVMKTEINVIPKDNENIPIRKLTFEGFSSLRTGDIIRAVIPRYRDDGDFFETENGWISNGPDDEKRFVDRDYKETEEAIEIQLLTEQFTALRIERSANYGKYFA